MQPDIPVNKFRDRHKLNSRKGGGFMTISTDLQMRMLMMAKRIFPKTCPISDLYSLYFEEKTVLIMFVTTI